MKMCNKCSEIKPDTEFHTSHTNKDGLFGSCKLCRKKRDNCYYKANRKTILERNKKNKAKTAQLIKGYKRRHVVSKHNNNDNKSRFLGMPYGTAYHRLRKSLLFSLVQGACRDVCYRCGEKIGTIDDFSIEHKKPWLYESVSKFWDLNNIAFSHLSCNISHSRPNQRHVAKNGRKWCNICKEHLPLPCFHKDRDSKGGYMKRCIPCDRVINCGRLR